MIKCSISWKEMLLVLHSRYRKFQIQFSVWANLWRDVLKNEFIFFFASRWKSPKSCWNAVCICCKCKINIGFFDLLPIHVQLVKHALNTTFLTTQISGVNVINCCIWMIIFFSIQSICLGIYGQSNKSHRENGCKLCCSLL